MIKSEFTWPKNLVDILNKHWVMAPATDKIIRNDIFWTVFRMSIEGAKLINETLDYINGCDVDTQQYTIDDAKKVLSMLDEIGKMYVQSIKTKRKNEILDCAMEYEV